MSEGGKLNNLDVWTDKLPPGGKEWLSYASRGTSSETMFAVLTGFPIKLRDGYRSPNDGSDFVKCRILLAMVPSLKERLHEMKRVSPSWSVIVDHWGELEKLVDSENRWFDGDRTGDAPKTRKRMYELEMTVATNGHEIEGHVFRESDERYDSRGHLISGK